MKLLSIALLSIASVRSANTLKFVLHPGVMMTDPTGTTGVLEGPDTVELVVSPTFTPFERKVRVADSKGFKSYTCKYTPSTGATMAVGMSTTLYHRAQPGLVIDIGGSSYVTTVCAAA